MPLEYLTALYVEILWSNDTAVVWHIVLWHHYATGNKAQVGREWLGG